MKKSILTFVIIAIVYAISFGQNLTQTVRGTILDIDSKTPLIGANIIVQGSIPMIGATTNVDGSFRFENIAIGRINLQLSYMGYENKIVPNIEVNSGKEVVLTIYMQESTVKMDEVVVKAQKDKGRAINEMSLLSARSISVEETKRYAGGFDDPARIVSNFAGVSNTADGSSDIIVRGNAPKYMQWRLEGVEISSPYHFDDQNAAFGGLTALNNNLLTSSDFYSGAFSPEYGNVLSSVFDLNLRSGNNEKFESTIGLGLIGSDITLEGPFKKGYGGSFLINYRYSTASLIMNMGLIDMDGIVNYQDANAKVVLPTKKAGTFSAFFLGGQNDFTLEDMDLSIAPSTGDRVQQEGFSQDYLKDNYLLNAGINHLYTLNNSSYIKTSLSFSGTAIRDKIYNIQTLKTYNTHGEFMNDSLKNKTLNFNNSLLKYTYRGGITYNNKLNAKHKIQMGSKYAISGYDASQSMLQPDSTMYSLVDFNENVATLNNYISWRYRLNDRLTMVSGLHNMNVFLNNKSTLEPRIAFNWKVNASNSLHAGYGKHSSMEGIQHYFAKVEMPDGSIAEPNKDLDLLKSHHFVVGYEKRFSQNLMAKAEVYYQHMYDLPVENNGSSIFATINEGLDYRYVDLVNKGTGRNYGIELTLERFFDNSCYFLINTSLFNSSYKALDGVERNTRYNKNYLVNVLVGKEFRNLGKKDNKTLALNMKMYAEGGQKIIPLLRDASGNLAVLPENNEYYDYSKAYKNGLDNIFQLNLSASYKINRKKTTHEIFLDLQNLTNNTSRIHEFYNETEASSVGYLKQMGFFPNLMYKVYF